MITGCIFSRQQSCQRYKVPCAGSYHEKTICPEWGIVLATEKHLEIRRNNEKRDFKDKK
jgi:hypothetical protein